MNVNPMGRPISLFERDTHQTMSVMPHSSHKAGNTVTGGPRTTYSWLFSLIFVMLLETSLIESVLPEDLFSLAQQNVTAEELTGTASDWDQQRLHRRNADPRSSMGTDRLV